MSNKQKDPGGSPESPLLGQSCGRSTWLQGLAPSPDHGLMLLKCEQHTLAWQGSGLGFVDGRGGRTGGATGGPAEEHPGRRPIHVVLVSREEGHGPANPFPMGHRCSDCPLTDRLSPQVHSKDKKYVCKLCSRVFMSAASVGIKHGSRRHGVCADCAGGGAAGPLDGVGAVGSPELFSGDGPYLEDPDDPRGDGEEELGEDEDDGLAHEDALLGEDKEDEDSPRGPRSPLGSAGKDFAWIS